MYKRRGKDEGNRKGSDNQVKKKRKGEGDRYEKKRKGRAKMLTY